MIGKFVSVQGIVVNASRPYIKGRKLAIQCRHCLAMKLLDYGKKNKKLQIIKMILQKFELKFRLLNLNFYL